MFREIDAFLDRAYPGTRLRDELPFFDTDTALYRRLVSRNERAVANDLLREPCWLVTVGADPTPLLSTVDALEQRAAYLAGDYAQKVLPTVQWVAKIRGPIDLEAILQGPAGRGLTLLIAPTSARIIEQAYLKLYASSETDLARMVTLHPDSFRPAHMR